MLVPGLSDRRPLRTQPATTLAEIPLTLQPEALETKQELDAFYQGDIQRLRGTDRTGEMKICLDDAHADQRPFKAFLLGHPGVGKTTELSRLSLAVADEFRPLRLSVISELNPGTLRFYDVLLLILIRLVHEVSSPTIIGFEDTDLDKMLGWVREHLSTKWTKHLRIESKEFGAGVTLPFLKLFGNIKQATTRETGAQEYELSFVSELVDLINRVLRESNRLLRKHKGQQWLVILEDFEKIGLAPTLIKDLFTGLRPSLEGMDGHFVITIPSWLQYSEDAGIILPSNFQTFVIPDIAVYKQNHSPDENVIAALKSVVNSRARESLFEPGVLDRFCIASGGNLRDLFALIRSAMLSARLAKASAISAKDANGAIASLRNDYKQLLGSTGQDSRNITLTEKLDRLVGIYMREDPTVEVPNPVLYLLLRQRCILQYNGVGWIGVHPLVVDLLVDFAKLPDRSPGGAQSGNSL